MADEITVHQFSSHLPLLCILVSEILPKRSIDRRSGGSILIKGNKLHFELGIGIVDDPSRLRCSHIVQDKGCRSLFCVGARVYSIAPLHPRKRKNDGTK